MTTVGYGDIGVETQMEFNITLVLMFLGVIFYSQILTELFEMIANSMKKQAVVQHKIMLLKQVLAEIPAPAILRVEMTRIIKLQTLQEVNLKKITKNFKEILINYFQVDSKFTPNFENVNANDTEALLYEAFMFHFDGIDIFQTPDKSFVIEFAQNMKKQIFNQGEKIYKRGDPADKFYVLKRGSVQFYLPGAYKIPFVKVESGYFGELELMELDSVRDKGKRDVTCEVMENDTKLYVIDKTVFFNLFVNGDSTLAKRFRNKTEQRRNKFM